MSYNRLAVYGHRGWASSAIVDALAKSGAPLKVIHRPGSDVSSLPSSVTTAEVDVKDEAALAAALQDIDIMISLVGWPDLALQYHMIAAIKSSPVKLFSPSDLGLLFEEEAKEIPVVKGKLGVEQAAKEAGVPTTSIMPNSFAESGLDAPLKGIDMENNRVTLTGDSATYPTNFCTRPYVAAAYASIFAQTPIDQLANRHIALTELTPTGNEIIAAMTAKFDAAPEIKHSTVESLTPIIQSGAPWSLAAYCRKIWATGKIPGMMGTDVWEVPGYKKATLHELVVEGKLVHYKRLPQFFLDELNKM